MSETNDTPILDDSPVWNEEVPRIEARQKLKGGIDGNLNSAPRVLAQRTRWLKDQIASAVQQANDDLAAHEAAADPHGDRAYAAQMVGEAVNAEAQDRQAADANLQAQITAIGTRVTALEDGGAGGGAGGGTISADTVINYPGAYANWAALIADLKGSVYTGTVTVNVAAGTYTEAFDFGTDLNMPNLHVVFDAAAQLDTTGWAPNFFIYTCGIKGVNCAIGSISGTLTRVGDANPVFAMAGVNFRVGYGTSDGLLPVGGGTMTDMAFVNFERGVSMVRSELVGYGKLVMTGLRTGQGEGLNAFGSMIRGLELELDGDVVNVGGAYSGGIADGGPFGGFRGITFTGTVGATRYITVKDGALDLGNISNTGSDTWCVTAEYGADATARIVANSTFSPHNGGNPLSALFGGKLTAVLLGDVTWKPFSINSRFTGGDGHLDLANYTGTSTLTVDNSGGVTPDFLFGHQYGSVQNITPAGNFGFVHQFGANKYSNVSLIWNPGVSPTQQSGAATGSTVKVDPSASTLYHLELALVDTLTIDLGYLAADQDFMLLSYYGVTNLAFTEAVTNAPAGLAANVPVRLKKMNGNWYAI